jgi:two-component system cell cycle response regulator CtrA
MIRTGKVVVNLNTGVVDVDNHPVHLTGKEYGILELLSLHKGTTVTREMLLDHLYGGMDEPELKIIDGFVSKLRKKLVQATGGEHYIVTVSGGGYVLRDLPDPAVAKERKELGEVSKTASSLAMRPVSSPRISSSTRVTEADHWDPAIGPSRPRT